MVGSHNTKTDVASTGHDLNRLAQFFIDAFPVMNITEQRLALKLYALLSEGGAVPLERLCRRSGMSVADITTTLKNWPGVFYDGNHHIIGFWGIAVDEMPHRLEINGTTVYTWCAWDTLFIPELLGATALITSHCASSGDEITLTISPIGIESQSDQIMVSFLVPDENELIENITTSFCHYVFFFRTRASAEHWITEHPGTFLLSLDEAFTVGRKMNAARYNLTLH